MQVKVEYNGVTQFVPEEETSRISSYRTNFNATIEMDPTTGKFKRYSGDDLVKLFALDGVIVTPEDIYGIVVPESPVVPESTDKGTPPVTPPVTPPTK